VRRNLLVAAVCILTFPMWFSPDRVENSTNATPFAVVALAGHTPVGLQCDCGTTGCICEPGEVPRNVTGSQGDDELSDQDDDSGLDFGSGALLLALAFMLWIRLRA
jgi:hypothetical protein